jgi:hypothetical protein
LTRTGRRAKNNAMKSTLFLCLAGLLLASCAGPVSQNQAPFAAVATMPGSAAETRFASPPNERPGLGTKWGETRKSSSGTTSFVRATPNDPLATAEIFYNDRRGIEAMAAQAELSRTWAVIPDPAAHLLSLGLRDESGRLLPGERWRPLVCRRRSGSPLCDSGRRRQQLSIGGGTFRRWTRRLGRPASFRKRGYVIDPHRTLVVDGFRQSSDAVAAFRFSSMNESYAHQKYHNSNNVGVIGAAIFNEAGTFPWTKREAEKRLRANPFPRYFATPP